MMKKLFSLLLALLLLFSLTACSTGSQLESELRELESILNDSIEEEGAVIDSFVDLETLPDPEETAPTTDPIDVFSEPDASEEPAELVTETVEFVTSETTESPVETVEDELPIDLLFPTEPTIDEYGTYTTKEDVALYIHTYGRLPYNFITKNEARKLGWEGGSLEPYAPGMCIGGDRFGNYEELLPTGRTYTECDIDTLGARSRGAKRIVFSNDGLIYYTDDHYESFTLLYGEE